MKNDFLRQWINLFAVLATLVVNGLANALPLNGLNTGEISDRFHVYFVPAGYVFSIWGVIYLGLIAFGIYQLLPGQRENPRLRRIGYLFALSCLANIVWLFLWHYERFVLTLFAMVALLLLLIGTYLRLEIGKTKFSLVEKWCVSIPFSVYLGWITVATIANVTSVLDYLKWEGWGLKPEIWAVVMLVAGLLIAAAMSLTRADVAYLLVIIWAYIGIAVKQAGTPLVSNTAWIISAIVAILLVIGWFLRRQPGYQHAG